MSRPSLPRGRASAGRWSPAARSRRLPAPECAAGSSPVRRCEPATDHPQMQPDRKHARPARPFAPGVHRLRPQLRRRYGIELPAETILIGGRQSLIRTDSISSAQMTAAIPSRSEVRPSGARAGRPFRISCPQAEHYGRRPRATSCIRKPNSSSYPTSASWLPCCFASDPSPSIPPLPGPNWRAGVKKGRPWI
jgi:hypothetical protein